MSESSEQHDAAIRETTITRETPDDFEGYFGFVKFDEADSDKTAHRQRDMVTIVGFVNEVVHPSKGPEENVKVEVVEAFAMSVWGWSHADLGKEHMVPFDKVEKYHLQTEQEWRQELENSGA